MIHPLLKAAIIGLITSAIIAPVMLTPPYRSLELRLYDQRLRLRPLQPVTDSMVIIAIDDGSIENLGRWPWTRDRHAALVETLVSLGAESIFFDVEFLEDSPATIETRLIEGKVREEIGQRLDRISQDIRSFPAIIASNEDAAVQDIFEHYSRKILEEKRAIEADIDRVVVDYDRMFARSVRRSGMTFLAFHPTKSIYDTGKLGDLYPSLREIIAGNYDISAGEVARTLSLEKKELKDVRGSLLLLKRRVALDSVMEKLAKTPGLTLDSLLEGSSPDAGPFKREIMREALERAKRMRYVREKFGREIKVVGNARDRGGIISPAFLEVPIVPLLEASKGLVHVEVAPDLEDGVVRKIPLFIKSGDKYFLQLGVQAACEYLDVEDKDILFYPGRYLVIKTQKPAAYGGEVKIPVNGSGQALVNYAGRPGHLGWKDSFQTMPYAFVLKLRQVERELQRSLDTLDGKYRGGSLARLRRSSGKDAVRKGQIEKKEAELMEFIRQSLAGSRALLDKEADPERKSALNASIREMQEELDTVARLKALRGELADSLRARVEGKICIVGAMFTGGTDFLPTSYDPVCPSVILHAGIINMILQNRFIKYDRYIDSVLIVFFLGPLVGFLTMLLGSLIGGGALAGIIAVYLAVSYLLLAYYGIWVHVAGPLLAAITSFTAVTVFKQLTEERRRREIKGLFQQYLHPSVVDELVKDPAKVRLGGERKVLTVHFSDLYGFTAISERLGPEELESLLNAYMSAMSDVILRHGGTVDKYEGDAIMAFYGAPVDRPDHALRACAAALESVETLKKLNLTFKEKGWPALQARMGINTGSVIVGNMGTKTHFNYTVIGDSVNTAAYLETANKFFNTDILIGEETREQAKDGITARYLGLIRTKGRAKLINVYELVALGDRVSPTDGELSRVLSAGIGAYQKGRWEQAMEYFSAALALRPDFGPARLYMERCEQYRKSPPGAGWMGDITLEETRAPR